MIANQQTLREYLDYNPSTGIFIWKKATSNRVRAGDEAGSNRDGYISINIFGKRYKAHRIALFLEKGEWPESEVDHINGITDDNRASNLRSVSLSENSKNSKRYSTNTSGVTGVYWFKPQNKWKASIKSEGNQIHLGYADSFEEACVLRSKGEIKYGFHATHGRES